jgi:hypothetical protein
MRVEDIQTENAINSTVFITNVQLESGGGSTNSLTGPTGAQGSTGSTGPKRFYWTNWSTR